MHGQSMINKYGDTHLFSRSKNRYGNKYGDTHLFFESNLIVRSEGGENRWVSPNFFEELSFHDHS